MDEQFLGKLSNADALAGDEEEVRELIRKRLAHLELREQVDGLERILKVLCCVLTWMRLDFW